MNATRPTLVMLPGTLCDARLFARQRRGLRHAANVRLIDYRDLKPSRIAVSPAGWVRQLLSRLPATFSLAGFSLGGIWALEILRQAPERVERLAMIASNAQGASARGKRNSRRQKRLWRQRGAGPLAVLGRGLPNYFHHEADRRRHLGLLRRMALATPTRSAFAQFALAGSRPDGLATLARFEGATLIVSGAKDRLCPPRWQQAMAAARPDARWLEVARTGHFVPLEAGSRLTAALQQWLESPGVTATNRMAPAGIAATRIV